MKNLLIGENAQKNDSARRLSIFLLSFLFGENVFAQTSQQNLIV
jgi:hypothetical protein